jgi:hypothetical protein
MSKRCILVAAVLALLSPAGCNKGRKDSAERNIAKVEQGEPEQKPAPPVKNETAPAPEEESTTGTARDEGGPPSDSQGTPSDLPNLSGFSGMDPDSFPEGEEGLDAIVQLWADTGEDARKKADMQDAALAGKTLRTAKELSKCLPDKVAGWKIAGKVTMTEQKHKGSILPMASRSFNREEGVKATMTILDTLKISEIRVGYEMGLTLTKTVKSPRQKLITIEGTEGYILVHQAAAQAGKAAESKGALLVASRFLVVLTLDNLADFDETYKILSSAKISKIKDLDK